MSSAPQRQAASRFATCNVQRQRPCQGTRRARDDHHHRATSIGPFEQHNISEDRHRNLVFRDNIIQDSRVYVGDIFNYNSPFDVTALCIRCNKSASTTKTFVVAALGGLFANIVGKSFEQFWSLLINAQILVPIRNETIALSDLLRGTGYALNPWRQLKPLLHTDGMPNKPAWLPVFSAAAVFLQALVLHVKTFQALTAYYVQVYVINGMLLGAIFWSWLYVRYGEDIRDQVMQHILGGIVAAFTVSPTQTVPEFARYIGRNCPYVVAWLGKFIANSLLEAIDFIVLLTLVVLAECRIICLESSVERWRLYMS